MNKESILAVSELGDQGIGRDRISLVASDEQGHYSSSLKDDGAASHLAVDNRSSSR